MHTGPDVMKLAIVVPILNEVDRLPDLLSNLLPYKKNGCEVLLVDGGSDDGSIVLAECVGFKVLAASRGRARQMNAGAREVQGDVLLFLHADTRLPARADELILQAMSIEGHKWGRFDVCIDGKHWMLRIVALLMNYRSRMSGIATGDQGIFVRRSVFETVNGFPDQPLMEDIALSITLRQKFRPVCLTSRVVTSGRRWETRGVWRTILLMWRLRLAYWLGAKPEALLRDYQ